MAKASNKNDPAALLLRTNTGEVAMTDVESVVCSFTPITAAGTQVPNPKYAPGKIPEWSGGDGVVNRVPAADGMTCRIDGIHDVAGVATIKAVAQMITSKGEKAISGTIDITVTVHVGSSDSTVLLLEPIGPVDGLLRKMIVTFRSQASGPDNPPVLLQPEPIDPVDGLTLKLIQQ